MRAYLSVLGGRIGLQISVFASTVTVQPPRPADREHPWEAENPLAHSLARTRRNHRLALCGNRGLPTRLSALSLQQMLGFPYRQKGVLCGTIVPGIGTGFAPHCRTSSDTTWTDLLERRL